LVMELDSRYPAPSSQTTHIRTRGVRSCTVHPDIVSPHPGFRPEVAARSTPGTPIFVGNYFRGGERLNSNRGHIDGEILVRYDKGFIVYDPELVSAEKIRIKRLKQKRATGHGKRWAKGDFTWGVIKNLAENLRLVLVGQLSGLSGTSVKVNKCDSKHKSHWWPVIDSWLDILFRIRTREELDETGGEEWLEVVTQLTTIGEHFSSYDGEDENLLSLLLAINRISE